MVGKKQGAASEQYLSAGSLVSRVSDMIAFGVFCLFVIVLTQSSAVYAAASSSGCVDRTYAITAYYSPLPGQQSYVNGNYKAELYVNGQGTHGASGKPVFWGMVAAPKSYPFGSQIVLDGLGVFEVADRGGAIVHAGQRGQMYDRIDIWVGRGDVGRRRALWRGKRNVTGQRCPAQTQQLAASAARVDGHRGPQAPRGRSATSVATTQTPLPTSSVSQKQKTPQPAPQKKQQPTTMSGSGDTTTSPPQPTPTKPVAQPIDWSTIFTRSLGFGDEGDDVRALQALLIEWKVLDSESPTGRYDTQTRDAVCVLQTSQNLTTQSSYECGYFGAHIRQVVIDRARDDGRGGSAAADEPVQTSTQTRTQTSQATETPSHPQALAPHPGSSDMTVIFTAKYAFGDQGAHVDQLQQALGQLGYLSTPSGRLDTPTWDAICAFQVASGVLPTGHKFCGTFGPQTKQAMRAALGGTPSPTASDKQSAQPVQSGHSSQTDQAKKQQPSAPQPQSSSTSPTSSPAQAPVDSATQPKTSNKTLTKAKPTPKKVAQNIPPSYAWNARGSHIDSLQAGLEQLGYLDKDDMSGSMDQSTATALCKFQVREGMLAVDSPRCGTVGKLTFARLEKRTGKHICPSKRHTTKQ